MLVEVSQQVCQPNNNDTCHICLTPHLRAQIFMSWDFGVISTRGIPTHVRITNANVLDSKHGGILILKRGGMHQSAEVGAG